MCGGAHTTTTTVVDLDPISRIPAVMVAAAEEDEDEDSVAVEEEEEVAEEEAAEVTIMTTIFIHHLAIEGYLLFVFSV